MCSVHLASGKSIGADFPAAAMLTLSPVTVLHDIQSWLPVLDAMLEDAPPSVESVHYTATMSEGSVGWSSRYDGERPAESPATHHFSDAARHLNRDVGRQFGAILHATRSGRREVDIVELPDCAAYGVGGQVVGDLVREDGALPALYRRQATPNPAAQPAPSADAEALRELIRRRMPGAEPATSEQIDAVEAALGVALPDEVRALYMAAGRDWLVVKDDPEGPGFYGMGIIPLEDVGARSWYLPQNRLVGWKFGAIDSLGPDPTGRVQPLAGSPLWFPVGTDVGGNLYCADLAPAASGYRGQVIFLDHELGVGANLVSDSFTDLLVHQRESQPAGPVAQAATVYLNRVAVADAATREDLEVVCLGIQDGPVDLAPLLDHPGVRTIDAAGPGELANPLQVTRFPALEYLSMRPHDWRTLLDAASMPASLLAAHVEGTDVLEVVAISNEILAIWGRPPITVTQLRQEKQPPRR